MQLTVLGATGRTGVHVVRSALARGHRVVALARSAEKAQSALGSPVNLTVVTGDLLDPVAVKRAVEGSHAVLNVAGQVKGAPQDLQQRAIRHVLAAMESCAVERLVTLTGAGVRLPGDRPGVADRAFGLALRLLQPALLADSVAYVEAVRASALRWTVVRAPRLTDGPGSGTARAVPHVGEGSGTKVTRADLAAFLVHEVEADRFVHQAPVVSG